MANRKRRLRKQIYKVHSLLITTDLKTGNDSKNSIELGFSVAGETVFDIVATAVNTIRAATDAGELEFVDLKTHREVWRRVERRQVKPRSRAEIEDFLCGKAFMLGFMVAPAAPSDVWAVDPWDATYLGVATRELLLGMRSLIAKGLLEQGIGPEYVKPSNKLLSEWSSETPKSDVFQAQQNLTRTKLPLNIAKFLPQHPWTWTTLRDSTTQKAIWQETTAWMRRSRLSKTSLADEDESTNGAKVETRCPRSCRTFPRMKLNS
jgi:hypothetical protein